LDEEYKRWEAQSASGLELAGIEFIDGNGSGPGALRKRQRLKKPK
jgi:hypothetical protein